MIVVPRGVEHKTSAETEAKLMLIEPRGVLNTGHEGGERTAVNDVLDLIAFRRVKHLFPAERGAGAITSARQPWWLPDRYSWPGSSL